MKIVTIHKGEIAQISKANGDPPEGYNTDNINGHISGCEKPEGVSSPLEKKFVRDRGVNLLRSNESHGEKENSCVSSNTGGSTPVGGREYVRRPQNTTGFVHIGEGNVEKETSPTRRNNPCWGRGTNGTPSTEYQRSEDAESPPCRHSNCSVRKNNFSNGGHSRLVNPPNGFLPNRGGKYTSNGQGGEDQNIYFPRSWKGGRPNCAFSTPVEDRMHPSRGGKEEEGDRKEMIPHAYEAESTVDGKNGPILPGSTSGSTRNRAIFHHREKAEEGENRPKGEQNVHRCFSKLIETKGGRVQLQSENGKRLTQVNPRSVGEWKNQLEGNHGKHLPQGDAIIAKYAPHGSGKSNVKRERLPAKSQKGEMVMGSTTCQSGGGPVCKGNEKVEEGKRRKRGKMVGSANSICIGGEKNESFGDTHTKDKKEEESSPVKSLLVFDEITNTWNILWKYGGVSIIKSYSIDAGGSASRHVALNDLQSINNLYGEVTTGVDNVTPEKTWDLMRNKIYKKFGDKYFFIGKDDDRMNGNISEKKNKTQELQYGKSDVSIESIAEFVLKMRKKLREAQNDGNRVKCEQICSMGHDTKGESGKSFNVERKSVIPFGQSSEDSSLKCEKERKFRKGRSNEGGSGQEKEGAVQIGETEETPTRQSKGKEGLTLRRPTGQVPTANAEERRELMRRRQEKKLKEELARKERKLRREEEKEKKIQMKEEKKRMREEKKKLKEQEKIKMREEKVNLRKLKKLEKWENSERLKRWKKMKKLERMEKLGRLGRRERIERQEKLERQGRLDKLVMMESLDRTEGLNPKGKSTQVDRTDRVDSVDPIIEDGRTTKGNTSASKLNSSPGKDEGNSPDRCNKLGETNSTPDLVASVLKISLQEEERKRLFLEKKQKVLKVMRKNVLVQGKVYLDGGYGDDASGGEGRDECENFGDHASPGNTGSWVVSWVLYGRTCRKRFPIEDYGFEEAKQMAEKYKRDRVNFILNNVSEYDTYVREVLSSDPEEGSRLDACTLVASQEQLHHEQLIEFCCGLLKNPVSEEHWKNKVKWIQNKKSWNIEIVKKEQNKFIREKIYYSEEKYGYIIGKCIAVYDYLNAEHKLLKNYFDVNVANLQYDSKRHAWKISRYVPNQLNKKNYYFDVGVYGWMYSRKLGLLLAIYLNTRRPLKGDEETLSRSCSFVRHLQEDSVEGSRYLFRENSVGEDHSKRVESNFHDDVIEGADLPSPSGQHNPCKEKSVRHFHANVVVEDNEVGNSFDGTCEGGSPTSSIVVNPGEEEKKGYLNAPCGSPDGASEDGHPVKMDRGSRGEVKRGRKRKKKTNAEEERTMNCGTDDEGPTNKRRHSQNEEEKMKNKTTQNGNDLKKLYETVHNRKYCQLKEMHTCGEKELLNFLSNEKDRALFLMEDIHIQGEDEHYLVNILENYYYYNLCRKMLKVRKKLSM
ncbi:Uncharacterized protein PCOAH_00029840 [Plasmodium coatneyi]|uniref:Uncharacterized protein n=1 Tax=Plasmodium coatneyi TaxID=208452 RepID=A0A1B1E115_9APIC|nr:Uncharacterized protein PCOAH_00029840 [Plasmodium coatneyi]ANQ08731.1 Uncharacterized protein PCOAH_00029840 [Plasmodium coatneyi]